MTAPYHAAPGPDPAAEPRLLPAGDFWEKHSPRFEFPLSWTAAVLVHVLAALALVVGLPLLTRSADTGPVPMLLVDVIDDDNGVGPGKDGSGGFPDPIRDGDADPFAAMMADRALGPVVPLPAVIEGPITAPEEPQEKTAPSAGGKAGTGEKAGTGGDPKGGTGTGGGGDGPGGRSLRWSLRFTFGDSREYLKQLAAVKAVIIVPTDPANKKYTFIPDLADPTARREATADDIRGVAPRLKFFEQRPEEARAMLNYLGIKADKAAFYICFPKAFEDELARKEAAHANAKPEDLKQTVFEFRLKGDGYEVKVTDQKRK